MSHMELVITGYSTGLSLERTHFGGESSLGSYSQTISIKGVELLKRFSSVDKWTEDIRLEFCACHCTNYQSECLNCTLHFNFFMFKRNHPDAWLTHVAELLLGSEEIKDVRCFEELKAH